MQVYTESHVKKVNATLAPDARLAAAQFSKQDSKMVDFVSGGLLASKTNKENKNLLQPPREYNPFSNSTSARQTNEQKSGFSNFRGKYFTKG